MTKITLRAAPLALSALLVLSGCTSKPIQEPNPGLTTGDQSDGVVTTGSAWPEGYGAADLDDPSSPLYQRVIYFDYDSSAIRPQFLDVLRAHAAYLSSNTGAAVTLDGHTDERGTREYNLALGEHRAATVRNFLLAEGVAGGRVRTMSFGEEQPANPGHNESSWALNRRVELVY